MCFQRRDLILSAVGGFVAWGFLIDWFPTLRYFGYTLALGFMLAVSSFFAIVLLTNRSQRAARVSAPRAPLLALISPDNWQKDVATIKRQPAYHCRSLYPQSFVVSEGIDELLSLITRDFISSWHQDMSPSLTFVNEVDKVIRTAIGNVLDRLLAEDLISLIVSRISPILTSHLHEFDIAERLVRGQNLTRSVTEFEELNLAIASKYRGGHLHPAAALSLSDQQVMEQEHLRRIAMGLLPKLFPQSILNSRTVSVLIREILACGILSPLISTLSDPDTWNQLIEAYGQSTLQDRKTVRKLRAALDEHASPVSRSKRTHQYPRLSTNDSERSFERFVRAIRRCNNLSDARHFRALISSQLKRESMVEGQDQVYLRRLETAKRALDQKVASLSSGSTRSYTAATAFHFHRNTSTSEDKPLVDMMHDASGLSYFMEFMDRQNLMSLVQFWVVVDGFRNPLEDDFGNEISPSPTSWTTADRNDMALISEGYLSKPEFNVSDQSRQTVKDFLREGKRATAEQYLKARAVILSTQSAVFNELQNTYYPKFKRSDLWYKYLMSDEASKPEAEAQPIDRPYYSTLTKTPERRPLPPQVRRMASHPAPKLVETRRTAVSLYDVHAIGSSLGDEDSPRRSLDSGRSTSLFDDDYDTDPIVSSTQSLDMDMDTPNNKNEANQHHIIKSIEAALNDIVTNETRYGKLEDLRNREQIHSSQFANDYLHDSPRTSTELQRAGNLAGAKTKPSIASLGLVDKPSRLGVFADDLFTDQEKFIEDEYEDSEGADDKDPAAEVHEAAPGDLGLAEAIESLAADIERLGSQESVVDALTRKAELTNNTAELRILRKSKASIEREIHRKEMQKQQYIAQESDNSLYGRSSVQIKSIVVGKEEDGREFAMYVIEVQRIAGELMPAASWVVARRYSEFHELHHRLRIRYASVRNLEFPRRRMVMKFQKEFLHKRRLALEAYLQKLLLLPEICRSRDLRAFLSQRAIIPREELPAGGESKDLVSRIYNSVADGMDDFFGNLGALEQRSAAGQNLISSASSRQLTTADYQGSVTNGSNLVTEGTATAAEAEAELNVFEDRELEPFVKPICDLFLETFELNKSNNWLRGRAVVVVLHQLLGGTIERKVREGARSLFQDESLLRYLTLVKQSMWDGGKLRERKPRTAAERTKSRNEASLVLATLIPDLAGNVVGKANAQAAARRIYAVLNSQRLNTHLMFTILEEIVLALFGISEQGRMK